MNTALPLQVSFRDIPRSAEIESFVAEQAAHYLGHLDLTSLEVVIEQPHKHQEHGRQYHVRIEMGSPRLDDKVVISRDPGGTQADHSKLHVTIKDAFATAKRRITRLLDKRSGHVKRH